MARPARSTGSADRGFAAGTTRIGFRVIWCDRIEIAFSVDGTNRCVQLLAAVTPAKITFKLDDKLRTALDGFMRDMDLSTSAAIRVLLTHSLQNRLPANLDAAAAMLAEARREVRAQAKAALERALAELEND